MCAENPGNITGWMTDHDGKIRIATTTDGVNQSIMYRNTEKDTFQILMSLNFKDTFSPSVLYVRQQESLCGLEPRA